ncbi:hypothetical protein [Flavobacterium sp.]|uniref:hypothetical protein n=1 Tax=Flavobacterium sp. TaxID=239 RepID=UPI00121F6BAD|nr:hypothetical protein [Flavobacterium sp.]RZJ71781.1 MAG: hypothetical protein EOO49_08945 [Flavobacterium sp.]
MKQFLLRLTFSIAICTSLFSCGESTPTRQFVFLNSNDKELNLVVERDGEYEVDAKVPAHSKIFENLKAGKVKIMTFDGDKCINLFENYVIKKDSANEYTCIDLDGEIQYALVKTSYLYDGTNSLSQAISDAKGVNTIEFLGPLRNSDKEFIVDFAPKWPFEKLPKKIGAMEESWALVPIYSATENKEELNKYVDSYLRGLGSE